MLACTRQYKLQGSHSISGGKHYISTRGEGDGVLDIGQNPTNLEAIRVIDWFQVRQLKYCRGLINERGEVGEEDSFSFPLRGKVLKNILHIS